jgi:hypothetical protein
MIALWLIEFLLIALANADKAQEEDAVGIGWRQSKSLTVAAAKRSLKEIEAAINSDRSLFRLWRRDNETSAFIYETIRRSVRVHIPAAPTERS